MMHKISLESEDVADREVFVDEDIVKESCSSDYDYCLVGKLLLHKPFNLVGLAGLSRT